MSPRVMLFIPAYNCENQLPRVVAKIDLNVQQYVDEVVVIENRSTDGTLLAAVSAISQLKIPGTVLQNDENYSLGGSIKGAILYAMSKGYDFLVVVHGDDQADVRDLIPVLSGREFLSEDLVIGARFHPDSQLSGYSRVRTWGNRVLNAAFSVVAHRRVDDLIAGLNIFRVDFFRGRQFLNFPNNLTFDAHTLLYAVNQKARIRYIPVTWREEDQISNAKTVKQALTILRLLFRYLVTGARVFNVNLSGRPPGYDYPSQVISRVNS